MTTVLFATEYDTANVLLDLMTDPTNYHIFPLIVRYKASNRVEFVLQTLRCPDSVRVGTVLVCDAAKLQLSRYVEARAPIPVKEIREALDVEETREIYDHLFSRRGEVDDDPTQRGDAARLSHLAFFNRTAVIEYLNDTYQTPTSPSWFLATYGGHEGTALLSMSYYLFERQLSTIQTTRGYTVCYTGDPGAPIPNHVTMREFMAALLGSRFRKETERFARYAKARNARDGREMDRVDKTIDEFRDASRLPGDTCIRFAYLAYSTALSPERIRQYCLRTEFRPELSDDEQCKEEEDFLARGLEDSLVGIMKTYFSPENYFQTYVSIERGSVKKAFAYRGYDWRTDSPTTRIFFGTSAQVTEQLRQVNELTGDMFDPTPASIAGLLTICASGREAPMPSPTKETTTNRLPKATRRNYLMKSAQRPFGPLPAFRVEMPGRRHLFACIAAENWEAKMFPSNLDRDLPSPHGDGYIAPMSDEALTELMWPHEAVDARHRLPEQMYRTRHEIFNENLPVFNFVADVDLKLKRRGAFGTKNGIGRRDFFDLLRAMRRAILDAWTNLFPEDFIDHATYPIYFFKSSCDATSDGGEGATDFYRYEDAAAFARCETDDGVGPSSEFTKPAKRTSDAAVFCTCRDKLGMRIIVPFPKGTVVVGSAPMKRLARTVEHAMYLNRDLVSRLNEISDPGDDCFDAGIYANGRSTRMPWMYKLDDSGFMICRRLVPIYIVPSGLRAAPRDFVLAHFRPENLTHHGDPSRGAQRVVSAIFDITDRACGNQDVSFTQKYIKRDDHRHTPRLMSLVRRHLSVDETTETGTSTTHWDAAGDIDGNDDYEEDEEEEATHEEYRERIDGNDDDGHERESGPQHAEETSGATLHPEDAQLLSRFARTVAWPKILELAKGHYREEAYRQLETATIFRPVKRNLLAVKRAGVGFRRELDFRCLNYDHQFRWNETVNVFLDLRADANRNVWATLWTRCFAKKCNSNARQTHLSVKIPPNSHY